MTGGLSNRMLGDVNKCFLELYSRFEKGENPIRVDREQSGDNGKFSVWTYGTMGFARIRESLAAQDFICKDKEKISGEGKIKTRMLIRPTPKGFETYRNGGQQIKVQYPMDGPPGEISVGIGSLYTKIDDLQEFYEALIARSGRKAPKYRRETWAYEFYQMIPDLVAKLQGEAELQVEKWIKERLQQCRIVGIGRRARFDIKVPHSRGRDLCLEKWMGGSK